MTDAPRPDLTAAKGSVKSHVLYRGEITGRFYFATKVEEISPGLMVVRGRKYDVTEYLQPYLKAKFLRKVK